MGKTLAEKILSEKSGTDARAGDIVIAKVDLAFVQDTTGPLTVRQFQTSGMGRLANAKRTVLFIDHAAPSPNASLSNDHILLRDFSRQSGCILVRSRGGRLPPDRPGGLRAARRRYCRGGLAHGHGGRAGGFRHRHGLIRHRRGIRSGQKLVPRPGDF